MGSPDFSQGLLPSGLQGRSIGAFRLFGGLAPSTPSWVDSFTSNGGTTSQNSGNFELSTDGTANATAGVRILARAQDLSSGQLILYFVWNTNQSISNLASNIEIGLTQGGTIDVNDLAAFRPSVGDDTSGNVRVDDAGTDTDGKVSYPTISGEWHYYSIVVDFDATVTQFYIDSNPYTASPDAEISATPSEIKEPSFHIGVGSDDGSEVLRCRNLGMIYIP